MAKKSPEHWMRRAIALSKRGLPAPNPHVGCVLVKNGEIVGEGYHRYAGGLHAEAEALLRAGGDAKGAEAFVTLEPCNHVGRQPPCTEALIRAGLKKVSYACGDPNPRVAGGGAQALQEAGLEVERGLLESEAADVNRVWLFAMRNSRPFVTAKVAMTLDGRIALPTGESKWITGEAARRQARRLRAEMGAVLVGAGTVLKDDPALTARIPGHPNEPVRIVLDADAAVPATARLFREKGMAYRMVPAGRKEWPRDIELPILEGGFQVEDVLRSIPSVTSVLVEGGAHTISHFFEQGLVDRLELFIGNVAFGAGPSWLQHRLSPTLEHARRWTLVHARRLENDVWLRYEPPVT